MSSGVKMKAYVIVQRVTLIAIAYIIFLYFDLFLFPNHIRMDDLEKAENDHFNCTSSAETTVFQTTQYGSDYCVLYNYWTAGDEYLYGDHITMFTHLTVEFVPLLEEHLKTWDGGFSLSLFIPAPNSNKDGVDEPINVLESQVYLKAFFSYLSSSRLGMKLKNSQQISFHLYFEKGTRDSCPSLKIPDHVNCDGFIDFRDESYFEQALPYPINVGRNIARLGVTTALFISNDIEQFFVKNSEPRLFQLGKKILIKEKKKTVLVHRRFEIEEGLPIPETKRQLAQLVDEKKAYSFHALVFDVGHGIPHLREWFDAPEDLQEITVSEEVPYLRFEWEPQYVGDARVPLHDERFQYALRDNQPPSRELCFKNFTFSVVTDVFTVHRGIKRITKSRFKVSRRKTRYWDPSPLEKQHYTEFAQKYPEMADFCPQPPS